VNGESEINEKWVNTANAIESDLSFDSDGNPTKFYHGTPCDLGRDCEESDDILTHFKTIRKKAQAKDNFVLFWIDLKLTVKPPITDFYTSGQKVAQKMTAAGSLFPLGEDVPINVLLGAEELNQKDFFKGFRQYISANRPKLLPKFGYDFSGRGLNVDDILHTFKEIGITENIWVGAGISSSLPNSITEQLKTLVAERDSDSAVAPCKVYAWTVNKASSMRYYLQLGIDAIIVNYPSNMNDTVVLKFHDSLSLATRGTDPWRRIKSTEAVTPYAQGCSLHTFRYYCWKYTGTGEDDWCWTNKRCNSDSDCWGYLNC